MLIVFETNSQYALGSPVVINLSVFNPALIVLEESKLLLKGLEIPMTVGSNTNLSQSHVWSRVKATVKPLKQAISLLTRFLALVTYDETHLRDPQILE